MKVPEFPGTIQGSRVENDVIVDVRPVCMGGHNESVFALGKSFGQLLANGICFFWCYFSRLEGLPNLIGDHVMLLPPPGDMLILTFCQQKLLICRHGVALIGSDKFSIVRFLRVLHIICPGPETLGNTLALIDVQCNQSCGSYIIPLLSYRKREPDQAVKLPLILFISFLPVE